MTRKMTPQEMLLASGTPQELLNSVNCAFEELVTSENFTELDKKDRTRLVFHWEVLRDYLQVCS